MELREGTSGGADAGEPGAGDAPGSALFCGHRRDGVAGEAEHRRASDAAFWHRRPGDEQPGPQTHRSWDHSFRVQCATRTTTKPCDVQGKLLGVSPTTGKRE